MKHFMVGNNAQVIAYVSQNRFYKVVNFADNVLSKQTYEELLDESTAEAALKEFNDEQAFAFAERFGDVIINEQPEAPEANLAAKVPVTGNATPVNSFPPEMGLGVLAMQELAKVESSTADTLKDDKKK